jgi:hypothetical protein
MRVRAVGSNGAADVVLPKGRRGNVFYGLAFLPNGFPNWACEMRWPWPSIDSDVVLYQALDIAMAYLETAGQEDDHDAMKMRVATVILASYDRGVRHRIRLANDAIVALTTTPIPPGILKNAMG